MNIPSLACESEEQCVYVPTLLYFSSYTDRLPRGMSQWARIPKHLAPNLHPISVPSVGLEHSQAFHCPSRPALPAGLSLWGSHPPTSSLPSLLMWLAFIKNHEQKWYVLFPRGKCKCQHAPPFSLFSFCSKTSDVLDRGCPKNWGSQRDEGRAQNWRWTAEDMQPEGKQHLLWAVCWGRSLVWEQNRVLNANFNIWYTY